VDIKSQQVSNTLGTENDPNNSDIGTYQGGHSRKRRPGDLPGRPGENPGGPRAPSPRNQDLPKSNHADAPITIHDLQRLTSYQRGENHSKRGERTGYRGKKRKKGRSPRVSGTL